MNTFEILKWVIIALVVLLLIVIVALLVVKIIHDNKKDKKKDYKTEFIKDMNNLNGPLYIMIKKQKNYDQIIEYIYDNNKEQINSVYSDNNTKDEFEELIESDCLNDELMYKILVSLDKKILHFLTNLKPSTGPDHLKGLIIAFLSIVYLKQGLNEIKDMDSSGSEDEHTPTSLYEMCKILACCHKSTSSDCNKNTLLTHGNPPAAITVKFLTESNGSKPALYNEDGTILKPKERHVALGYKFFEFIAKFSDGGTGVAVNYNFFNTWNKTHYMRILNKMKANLEKTICEKDTQKSSYNSAVNLFNTINDNFVKYFMAEILRLIPGFNPGLGPVPH
jgi:hypothetical protein